MNVINFVDISTTFSIMHSGLKFNCVWWLSIFPSLSNPMTMWWTRSVLPDDISLIFFNSLILANPLPLSNYPVLNTPRNDVLPLPDSPSKSTRISNFTPSFNYLRTMVSAILPWVAWLIPINSNSALIEVAIYISVLREESMSDLFSPNGCPESSTPTL